MNAYAIATASFNGTVATAMPTITALAIVIATAISNTTYYIVVAVTIVCSSM